MHYTQNLKSFVAMLIPNLYYYCKGHVWLQWAESWHLRTDTLGVIVDLIFRLSSGAGWIRLYRLAGMGMNGIG